MILHYLTVCITYNLCLKITVNCKGNIYFNYAKHGYQKLLSNKM